MQLGKSYFPAEIVLAVVGELPRDDIKNVRLVCKELADVGSRFLINKLWISPSSEDQQKMLAVSQHPIFRHTVEEVVYDATQSLHQEPNRYVPLTKAAYVRFLSSDLVKQDVGISVSKAAAMRGYEQYKQRCNDEETAARHTGRDCTRPHESSSLPDQFSLLLEQPASHDQVIHYLPSDLATLIQALPQLTKVKRFSVSDCRFIKARNQYHSLKRYGYADYPVALPYIIQNRGVRGSDAIVLKPRSWIDNDEEYAPLAGKEDHRGFHVMMQAASMLGLSLDNLTIDRCTKSSGLSCHVFDIVSDHHRLHHMLRAFANLRHLVLKLNTLVGLGTLQPGSRWSEVVDRGVIGQVCTAARGLETLDIQLNGPGFMEEEDDDFGPAPVSSLEKVVGRYVYPNLTSVTLGWMMFPQSDFLAFVNRQRQTLRRLILNGATVGSGPGQMPPQSWYSAFKAMAAADVKLDYFNIDNEAEYQHSWPADSIHFESSDSAAIHRFLASGGVNGNHVRPHGWGCRCDPYSPGSSQDCESLEDSISM